jgi:hypothetical protein
VILSSKILPPALVLRPRCVPEKVGINKKGVSQNDTAIRNKRSVQYNAVSQMALLKIRDRKLRSGVNLQSKKAENRVWIYWC